MSVENVLDILIHTSLLVSLITVFIFFDNLGMLVRVLSTFEKSNDVLSHPDGYRLTEKITGENCEKCFDRVN